MRAFIAIDLPADVRGRLGSLNSRLRKGPLKASWVSPDRMHLTLRFLGDIQEDWLSVIDGVLQPACRETPPFNLTVSGLGAFPNWKKPAVLWIGVSPPEPAFTTLQQSAERAAREAGLAPETKPFHPHISLARFKDPRAASGLAALAEPCHAFAAGEFTVSHVSLFHSELTSHGPLYTRIREYLLK